MYQSRNSYYKYVPSTRPMLGLNVAAAETIAYVESAIHECRACNMGFKTRNRLYKHWG